MSGWSETTICLYVVTTENTSHHRLMWAPKKNVRTLTQVHALGGSVARYVVLVVDHLAVEMQRCGVVGKLAAKRQRRD